MYSFQPLPDYSDVHTGFYSVCVFAFLFFGCIVALWKNDDIRSGTLLGSAMFFILVLYAAHETSYTPAHPKNELHVGKFVRYESEGYHERSGKTTVDRHFVYVVYNVDGNDVLFEARTGFAYPKLADVYKN